MPINWALALPQSNLANDVTRAFEQGQQTYTQNTAKNALAALVQDPNNPKALAALAKVAPEVAMQFRAQQAELLKQQLAQHQDNIIKGAEIIREFQPKDQQSYTAALVAAQRAGIDLSGVPQEYNPDYVNGIVHLADAMKPQPSDVSLVAAQPGAPVIAYNKKTNATSVLVAPNDGSHQVGAPATNLPQVHDQASYDSVPAGSQYLDPSGQVRTKGGQTAQAPSGGFQ